MPMRAPGQLSFSSLRTTSIVVPLALLLVACTRTPQSITGRPDPFAASSDARATITPNQSDAESSRRPTTALESGPAESPPSEAVDEQVEALVQELRDQPRAKELRCTPCALAYRETPEDIRMHQTFDRLIAVGRPATPALARILESSLQGSDVDLKSTILWILSDLRGAPWTTQNDISAALPALILALDDSDPGVRSHAGAILGGFGPQAAEAVPKLLALLDDENAVVRTGACNGLRGIEPLPALRQARSDPNLDKRQFAQRAIASIETKCLPRNKSGRLEALARTADLVCKATVIADRGVTDNSFKPIDGFEVREAELRIVSIVKGVAPNVIRFRHYAPSSTLSTSSLFSRSPVSPPALGPFAPSTTLVRVAIRDLRDAAKDERASYPATTFATGRIYIVLATQTAAGTYRELPEAHAFARHQRGVVISGIVRRHHFGDEGVLLAADAKPHSGTTLTEAEWTELLALLKSSDNGDVVYAIRGLDELSGGPTWIPSDPAFERDEALLAIQPLVGAESVHIATAAITVFGTDSPYFVDEDVPFWLAGISKGHITGLGPRKRPANPVVADIGGKELLQVATGGMTSELRALAIRALGRRSQAYPMVAVWARDSSGEVRRAAVLASADLPNREPIMTASTDGSPELRRTAAYAVGFAQDPRLLPILDRLLHDSVADVRNAAALSLLSYPVEQAASFMKANLPSGFRPLFINALASSDPQPYVAMLAEVMEQPGVLQGEWKRPAGWAYGGLDPGADAWRILFDFVKSRPAAELTTGKLDPSLNALERAEWFNSGQPCDLYALYLKHGLGARAKEFGNAAREKATVLSACAGS